MHEILLHIIDGPGAGWVWIVLGLCAVFVVLRVTRWNVSYEQGIRAGSERERQAGFARIEGQIAQVKWDTQQMKSKIDASDG
jgi:hypothetical protein